jgi:FkbM family methyltransferase
MLGKAAVLDHIHRSLSKSKIALRLAILLRNQCQCVIKYSLGGMDDSALNGEYLVLNKLAPLCRSFIDVGANIGDWTAKFLELIPGDGRGIACEPSDSAFARLTARFGSDPRCKLVQAAVSDVEGRLTFFEEAGAGETSSLNPSACRSAAVEKIVTCVTVESVVQQHGWETIDYLKVDVEGFDLHVLRGARSLLDSQKVHILQFEYNNAWVYAGNTLAAALDFLQSRGYRTYLLRPQGLFEFGYKRYGEFFTYSNFVAVAPSWESKAAPLVCGQL